MCIENENGEVIEKCEAAKLADELTGLKGPEPVAMDDLPDDVREGVAAKLREVRKANPDAQVDMKLFKIPFGEAPSLADAVAAADPEARMRVSDALRAMLKGSKFEKIVNEIDADGDESNEKTATDPEKLEAATRNFNLWLMGDVMKAALIGGARIRVLPGNVTIHPDVIRHVDYGEAQVHVLRHVLAKGDDQKGMDAPDFVWPDVTEVRTRKGRTLVITTSKVGEEIATTLTLK